MRLFLRAYKSLYYTLYIWILQTSGSTDVPEINAILGVALITCMNILNIFLLFAFFTGLETLIFPEYSKIELFGIAMAYLIIHSFIFFRKKWYRKIIEEFSLENKQQKKIRNRAVILYLILTPLLLIITLEFIS